MSKTKSDATSGIYSAPGKIFLLGEYAVLTGLPGIVVTLGPRFKLSVAIDKKENIPGYFPHPKSPAGRFLSSDMGKELSKFTLTFEDPLQGAGGFGASTAEFVMIYRAYQNYSEEKDHSWMKQWKLYRKLMNDEVLVPSGADLIAQHEGSIVLVESGKGLCTSLWKNLDWSNLLIFSATGQQGRKVATHEHLALLSESGLLDPGSKLTNSLSHLVTDGIAAIRSNDPRALGSAMDSYGETLRSAKLELPATYADRQALRSFSHVLGVKGAGALQADAILVLMEPNAPNKQSLVKMAQSRGLKLVSDELREEPGVQFSRA